VCLVRRKVQSRPLVPVRSLLITTTVCGMLVSGCAARSSSPVHRETTVAAPSTTTPPPTARPAPDQITATGCTRLLNLVPTPVPTDARVFGHSATGEELIVEHWGPTNGTQILILAQVHGDECGGLLLTQSIRERPPTRFGVWLVPTLNPDGAAAFTRKNGVRDLNRDGLTRSQPETRALLELTATVRPDLTLHVHSPYGWVGFYGASLARDVAVRVADEMYRATPRFAGSGYGFLWEGQSEVLANHASVLLEFPAAFAVEAATAPLAEQRRTATLPELHQYVARLRTALDAVLSTPGSPPG
jgi:protein MpaA